MIMNDLQLGESIASKNIVTVYSKLSDKQKKKIISFLKLNFINRLELFSGLIEKKDFDLKDSTIIILNIDNNNNIRGCVCLLYNKYLKNVLDNNNISYEYYDIEEESGCFIYNLCVHKDLRNQNIATNIIQYMINRMKECEILNLYTHAENEISKNVFLKNDFIVKKQNTNMYLMNKNI